jgi:hypothetical protein
MALLDPIADPDPDPADRNECGPMRIRIRYTGSMYQITSSRLLLLSQFAFSL